MVTEDNKEKEEKPGQTGQTLPPELKKAKTSFILFKELLRSIRGNIKQFFAVIAISFLAVCLFSGLTSNAYNLKERTEVLYNASNYADIYVTTTGLDTDDLSSVSAIEGITKAEKRACLPFTKERRGVNVIAAEDEATLTIPMMVQGERGFVCCDTYLTSNKLSLGGSIDLSITNYFLEKEPLYVSLLSANLKAGGTDVLAQSDLTLSFKITGTMLYPESVKTSKYVSTTYMYTDYSTVSDAIYSLVETNYDVAKLDALAAAAGKANIKKAISDFTYKMDNQILADSNSVETSLSKINSYFSAKSDNNLVVAARKESLTCYQGLQQDIDQALQLTFVFPVIFFLVSLLVILTTISQIIIRERMQIGSLKAIGVNKGQIYLHYISYGFFLTLLGSVLGFFVGPLFIPNVMNIKYKILWDIPAGKANFFYPMSIVMVVCLLAISILASFLVSYAVIKEKPVETLRPKTPKIKPKKRQDAKPLLASYQAISSKTLSFKMAMRNMARNKMKTVMVILGTLGCTALLVCGFGIMNSLDNCIVNDYDKCLVRDVVAVPEKHTSTLYKEVKNTDGVQGCYAVIQYPVSLASGETSVECYLNIMEEGCPCFTPLSGVTGGTVIDQTTAEKLSLQVGDKVQVIVSGKAYARPIAKIFTSSSLHGVYEFMTYDADKDTYVSPYENLGLSINNYWINCSASKTPEQIKDALKAAYPDSFDKDSSITTKAEYRSTIDELLGAVRIMTRVVEIFAILLSVVVTYNLTSLNISERTRDVATMKVLGFRYGEIAKTLITEIMLDTIIGTVCGLPLGFPLCVLVMAVNKNEFITYLYHINWETYLISAAISLLAAFAVNLLLTLRTKKIKMVESLKSIE